MRIPRSTFYATQETTPKQLREEALVKQIAEIQNEYFFTIGRRRMGTLLNRRFGISVCETDVVLIFWTLRSPSHAHTTRDQATSLQSGICQGTSKHSIGSLSARC